MSVEGGDAAVARPPSGSGQVCGGSTRPIANVSRKSVSTSPSTSKVYTGTAILTYEDGTVIREPEAGSFEGVTVGQAQVELTGPFDATPELRALGPGQHEVALDHRADPNIRVQTVLIQ